MRALQLVLFFIHGLIHLMGFSKAFGLAAINQVSQSISKAHGFFWFVAASLFMATAVIFFLRLEWWWMLAVGAVLLSQYLIIVSWEDAKFGTIGNAFILLSIIIGLASWNFRNHYRQEVKEGLASGSKANPEILSESEIQRLPHPVQRYLHYTGAVGKPKVTNFRIEFDGQLRQLGAENWMPITSQQYNFIQNPTRLFYLKATMKHLPVSGFHRFKNGQASMDIRLLSLFNVEHQSGKEMDVAETVTFFNDMCVLAPATLVDSRVKWTQEDGNMARAEFSSGHITISASLFFNDNGELINFVSEDRYATLANGIMEKVTWSTPLSEYKNVNGYKLATHAQAIYQFTSGDFCYGDFTLADVAYNVLDME